MMLKCSVQQREGTCVALRVRMRKSWMRKSGDRMRRMRCFSLSTPSLLPLGRLMDGLRIIALLSWLLIRMRGQWLQILDDATACSSTQQRRRASEGSWLASRKDIVE
jgi:hypothetical protein